MSSAGVSISPASPMSLLLPSPWLLDSLPLAALAALASHSTVATPAVVATPTALASFQPRISQHTCTSHRSGILTAPASLTNLPSLTALATTGSRSQSLSGVWSGAFGVWLDTGLRGVLVYPVKVQKVYLKNLTLKSRPSIELDF